MITLSNQVTRVHGGWQYAKGPAPRVMFCTGCFEVIGHERRSTGEAALIAHVAAMTETAVRQAIMTELTSRASALSPLVERDDPQPVTVAVHTALLEAVAVAGGQP